jgi:hypothetical protein
MEAQVNAALRALRALAASHGAESLAWADISPALVQFSEISPAHPIGWLARPDGSYTTTSDGGPAPDNLTARPYFRELLAGRDVEGAAIISAVSGQRAVVIATPIRRRGVVIGALGAEFSGRAIMEAFNTYYRLPADLVIIVLNDDGLIVLHSEQDRIFQIPDLSEQSLANAVRRLLSEENGQVTYTARGVPRTAVFNRSRRLGWRFMLARTGSSAPAGR